MEVYDGNDPLRDHCYDAINLTVNTTMDSMDTHRRLIYGQYDFQRSSAMTAGGSNLFHFDPVNTKVLTLRIGEQVFPNFKADDQHRIMVQWPFTNKLVYFKFKDYKKRFDSGAFGHEKDAVVKQVLDLRKQTVYMLISDTVQKLWDPHYKLNDYTAGALCLRIGGIGERFLEN